MQHKKTRLHDADVEMYKLVAKFMHSLSGTPPSRRRQLLDWLHKP